MLSDVALVRSPLFLEHRIGEPHPENSTRLSSIYELFEEELFRHIPTVALSEVGESLLQQVHAKAMCHELLRLRGESGWIDSDTYFSAKSLQVALTAAGSTVDLARKIWKGEFRRGFSLIRPPGHHATRERAMGFCLFNNVALAAQAILTESPNARLAIIDFDLHHGNGTQALFYDNPNVLFVSSHRYPFYPGSGAIEEVGVGKGKGTTINFPLSISYGDDFFIPLYREIVGTILKEFSADMILVSAGYDGHARDPMTGFKISSEGYGKLSEILIGAAELNKGKIIFCLEGGYDPQALKESVRETLLKLTELPRGRLNGGRDPSPQHEKLEAFRMFHRSFFPQL